VHDKVFSPRTPSDDGSCIPLRFRQNRFELALILAGYPIMPLGSCLSAFSYYLPSYVSRASRIIVHLTREDMGHEGRYLFLLLYFLTRHGEQVTLVRPSQELGTYGGLSRTLRTVSFRHEMPLPSPEMVLITDSEADAATAPDWEKVFWLDYDIYRDRASLKGIPYAVVPYAMHPLAYGALDGFALNTLHNLKRSIRLFFSGNADKRTYSGRVASNRFQMLSRFAALEFAKKQLANRLLTESFPQDLRRGNGAEDEHKFVVIESDA